MRVARIAEILLLIVLFFLCILTFTINSRQIAVYLTNAQGTLLNDVSRIIEEAGRKNLLIILGGIGILIIRFIRESFTRIKRVIDILLSFFGIALSMPLVLMGAILMKLTSRGAIIYKQDRVGKKGKIFKIYKLRTMYVDAEEDTGAVWAKEDDPRITLVGKCLRKTRIDEIPQLLNVLKGEMSIVGPRPERPEIVNDLKTLILDYEKRLQIKPGITGLAQIWHKYDETIDDVKKKIKYDLLYIRKMCLWVDVKILAQTLVVVLTAKGAH
jgi:lipopolysaccharide/colanic/teichoic acid biosynthesis glycosyltransferase